MTGILIAGVVGGPLSGWILQRFDNVNGMPGWQWLFLLEAIPSVVTGIVTFFCDYAGVWFDEVNEAYSTQTCSCCKKRTGPKGREDLGVREWTCSECNTAHHSDVNAARNILAAGHGRLAGGIPALTAQAAALQG